MTSSAVNAYYSPTRNQIVFPSKFLFYGLFSNKICKFIDFYFQILGGILQDPFFHPEK